MKSHIKRSESKKMIYNRIIDYLHVHDELTKINDLYDSIGKEYFSSKQYFVRYFIDTAKNDSKVFVKKGRRTGTFACIKKNTSIKYEIPKKTDMNGKKKRKPRERHITMNTNFGKNQLHFTGNPVTIEVDESTWKKCKSIPKMISDFYDDTVEVWRKDFKAAPSQYLQITNNKKYLFVVD